MKKQSEILFIGKKILVAGTSVVLITLLFSGCAIKTGNEKLHNVTQDSVSDMIKNGVTTKTEVKNILGEPTDVDFMDSGLEKWSYNHTIRVEKGINYIPVVNWFVRGTDDTQKTLVILFDGDIVKNHAFTSSEGETMGGLVR